jgi:hypothetical protein
MRTRHSCMTPWRQRMLEDLQLRNYSAHTIRAYLHCVAAFAKHFRTSPARLGPEQVRTYQRFLIQEKQMAWPSVVQTVCAWFCRKFSFEAICGMVSPTKPCCQGGERRWRSAAKEPIFRRILF